MQKWLIVFPHHHHHPLSLPFFFFLSSSSAMTEFIGAKISLISRSDIRYVGILHEINSEESTVALEQGKHPQNLCLNDMLTFG
jgi:hypothetical protein